MIDTALKMTHYAKEKGLFVIMSPFDTTRSDVKFLDKLLVAVVKEGTVDRVRLVDSMGTVIPAAMKWLVMFMRERLKGIPLEVHCHNDFGLARPTRWPGSGWRLCLNLHGQRVRGEDRKRAHRRGPACPQGLLWHRSGHRPLQADQSLPAGLGAGQCPAVVQQAGHRKERLPARVGHGGGGTCHLTFFRRALCARTGGPEAGDPDRQRGAAAPASSGGSNPWDTGPRRSRSTAPSRRSRRRAPIWAGAHRRRIRGDPENDACRGLSDILVPAQITPSTGRGNLRKKSLPGIRSAGSLPP